MKKDRLQVVKNNEEYKFVNLNDIHEHKKPNEQVEALPQQELQTPPTIVRRSSRISKVLEHYSPSLYYVFYIDSGEPKYFDEVMQGSSHIKWEDTKEEIDSLHKNQTWSLVELPKGKRALTNKWLYILKEEGDGQKRCKERLVVKDFAQNKGIDFDEIFSLVVKMTSIISILHIVAIINLFLKRLDVKINFLHGDLEEQIYMHQPQGFEVKGN